MRLFIKTKIYLIAKSMIGKAIFKLTKPLIKVDNLTSGKKNMPFLVAITVDTECGYVKAGEYRLWQFENPNAFQGLYYGIRNLRRLADSEKVPLTFLISGQALNANGREKEQVEMELRRILPNHEIGYHLHPTTDFALQKKLKKKLLHNSAKYYNHKQKVEMLRAGKELIERATKTRITSFRWGNWGLDGDFKALWEAGFKIDTSACPGASGHLKDDRSYDWRKCKTHIPFLKHGVTEVPIATFSYLGVTLLADPIYCDLLMYAFDYYYKNAARNGRPFVFVVITHTPEATYEDGRETPIVETLRQFMRYANKKKDVKFVKLKDTI